MTQQKRAQGRPSRGANEVGSQKIIDGMLMALRNLQTTEVTRKDIAHFAGVTPALITYYFPGPDSLVRAATLPVMATLLADVKASLAEKGQPRMVLTRVLKVLLISFKHDLPIIDLFDKRARFQDDINIPSDLCELEDIITKFFERLLVDSAVTPVCAEVLQRAAIGLCKALARGERLCSGRGEALRPTHDRDAELICDMLLWSVEQRRLNEVEIQPNQTFAFRTRHETMSDQVSEFST